MDAVVWRRVAARKARAADEEELLVGEGAQSTIANVRLGAVEFDVFFEGSIRSVQTYKIKFYSNVPFEQVCGRSPVLSDHNSPIEENIAIAVVF